MGNVTLGVAQRHEALAYRRRGRSRYRCCSSADVFSPDTSSRSADGRARNDLGTLCSCRYYDRSCHDQSRHKGVEAKRTLPSPLLGPSSSRDAATRCWRLQKNPDTELGACEQRYGRNFAFPFPRLSNNKRSPPTLTVRGVVSTAWPRRISSKSPNSASTAKR